MLYLILSRDDIVSALVYDDTLSLKLATHAASDLKKLTEENEGKNLCVIYEGDQILCIRIHASVESGIVQVANPPRSLLQAFDIRM